MDQEGPGGAAQTPRGQATPGAPAAVGPIVNWAPPPATREVPGAPGLSYADTARRLVAYLVDISIIGIGGLIIDALLGEAQARLASSGTSASYLSTSNPVAFVILAFLDAAYFILFWTGGRRATVGQRLLHVQVGNAFDGRALSPGQAVRRWIVLGGIPDVMGFVRPVRGLASVLQALWFLLLVSTATSPTKQGIHDRFANSAVVAPSGVGRSGVATALLLIVGVVLVLAITYVAVGLRGPGRSN